MVQFRQASSAAKSCLNMSYILQVTGGSRGIRKSGSVLNNESGQYPFEEVAESKFTSHSLDEVATMVHCIISLYESKVIRKFLEALFTVLAVGCFF